MDCLAVTFTNLSVTKLQAAASMLLSDCSARQHAATEEVEKAKAQLQELQVRCNCAIFEEQSQ